MKRLSLKKTLMQRDGLTAKEAQDAINEFKADMMARLEDGEMPFDIMEEHFGLEPDYLDEFMFDMI